MRSWDRDVIRARASAFSQDAFTTRLREVVASLAADPAATAA
jgi:hypothetical protein